MEPTIIADSSVIDNDDIMKKNDTDDVCISQKISNKAILYVISVISNPLQFERRYELFNEFVERMNKEKGVKLLTVELQN